MGLHGQQELISRAAEISAALGDPQVLRLLSERDREIAGQLLRVIGGRNLSDKFFAYYPETGKFARTNYPKHMEHYWAGKKYDKRALMAGNRTGKTICGGYETTCHLTGLYPDWWPGHKWNHPIEAWAAGKTNETAKKIIQAKLFGRPLRLASGRWRMGGTGLIPGSYILHDTATFRQGIPGLLDEICIRYKDSQIEYSTLGIKSYEQKRKVFEGTEQHWVWLDEEPPQDIEEECTIRTGTVAGKVVLTFTPLDGLTDVATSYLPADRKPVKWEEHFMQVAA